LLPDKIDDYKYAAYLLKNTCKMKGRDRSGIFTNCLFKCSVNKCRTIENYCYIHNFANIV